MSAVVFIPLTQGKVSVIDFEDFSRVRGFNWHAHRTKGLWYARRGVWNALRKNNDSEYLHNRIFSPPAGQFVDHKNNNGLDNRRENLRECSKAQNAQAVRRKSPGKSSKFRGVAWHKQRERWRASVEFGGRHIFLGLFDFEEDAAKAYDAAALKHFGEFAHLNFPVSTGKQ